MTADDKLEIRESLRERLRFLESRNLSIDASNCPDENEYASLVSEMHFNVVMRERESRQLVEVREALDRLCDPDFGYCEECGESIGLARLKANPQALFCIICQEQTEQAA
ncbi:TraR/DksA family transcriptional regulator [Desulfovibrio ferrophilus]|uniref:Transcriptional regulator, TraR/DksA family n=1 Tax=Desulfovibrio ferrophilus TaxID=241368 RepID=A0A2Z6AUW5_9BACT|nr:TraR/DksA C4-type zinc finger protein [Desulfovibrio ferrophilus]BBD07029.1 transcriptional regulator, TraR/DksA family [Desulfovibrio ferrophilus]